MRVDVVLPACLDIFDNVMHCAHPLLTGGCQHLMRGREMENAFIEKMKKLLLAQRQEILDTIAESNEQLRTVLSETDPKDSADVASDDVDRIMIEALSSQDLKRYRAIEAALLRINQGRYGLCAKCGKKIPQERLEAIPYAVLCVECQKSDERKNR
jgi:RNA polymerase-binding protein DksA